MTHATLTNRKLAGKPAAEGCEQSSLVRAGSRACVPGPVGGRLGSSAPRTRRWGRSGVRAQALTWRWDGSFSGLSGGQPEFLSLCLYCCLSPAPHTGGRWSLRQTLAPPASPGHFPLGVSFLHAHPSPEFPHQGEVPEHAAKTPHHVPSTWPGWAPAQRLSPPELPFVSFVSAGLSLTPVFSP